MILYPLYYLFSFFHVQKYSTIVRFIMQHFEGEKNRIKRINNFIDVKNLNWQLSTTINKSLVNQLKILID